MTRIVQKYMWKLSSIFCVYLGHLPQPASDTAWTCRGSLGAPEWGSSKSCIQFFFSLSLMLLACPIANQSSRTRHFSLNSNQSCYPDSPWTVFFQHGEKKLLSGKENKRRWQRSGKEHLLSIIRHICKNTMSSSFGSHF